MRDRGGPQRVTNVELFFDLVFVFAVTQLSHYLLTRQASGGGARSALLAALLLAMVWLLWAYTTWVTNWLDPDQMPVRLLLLGLAMVSLLYSAALPAAFGRAGLVIGAAYLVMQAGRSLFAVRAITDPALDQQTPAVRSADRGPLTSLHRNFQRILAWCVLSGSLALAGGIITGLPRVLLWAAAVAVDFAGGLVGFYTPWHGRSATAEWTIEGGHFAERCHGFILIAIGESLVVIGAKFAERLDGVAPVTSAEVAVFAVSVVSSVGFWWLYFDRSAGDAAEVIAKSADPGRLGRSAYHLIHPIMVAGIIVAAAADGALADLAVRPGTGAPAPAWAAWMILAGPALFLAGHAAFKAVIWQRISWQRIAAIVLLGLGGLLAPHVPALALGAGAAAVVVAVAVTDQILRPPAGQEASARSPSARPTPG
jgi:low temperature requirement protein LtrA